MFWNHSKTSWCFCHGTGSEFATQTIVKAFLHLNLFLFLIRCLQPNHLHKIIWLDENTGSRWVTEVRVLYVHSESQPVFNMYISDTSVNLDLAASHYKRSLAFFKRMFRCVYKPPSVHQPLTVLFLVLIKQTTKRNPCYTDTGDSFIKNIYVKHSCSTKHNAND